MPEPLTEFVITEHAALEILRRGLNEETIRSVLARPEQRYPVSPGREVFQARLPEGSKAYLLRVFVDLDRRPAEVVTAYRTSKIDKYWRRR